MGIPLLPLTKLYADSTHNSQTLPGHSQTLRSRQNPHHFPTNPQNSPPFHSPDISLSPPHNVHHHLHPTPPPTSISPPRHPQTSHSHHQFPDVSNPPSDSIHSGRVQFIQFNWVNTEVMKRVIMSIPLNIHHSTISHHEFTEDSQFITQDSPRLLNNNHSWIRGGLSTTETTRQKTISPKSVKNPDDSPREWKTAPR